MKLHSTSLRFLFFVCLIYLFSSPSVHAQLLPDYKLLKGGQAIEVPENIAAFVEQGSLKSSEEINGYYYRLIQFYYLPNKSEKEAIRQAGIQLLSYIPNKIYTAAIPTQIAPDQLAQLGIRSLMDIDEGWKLAPVLAFEDYGPWAVEKDRINLLLTYFSNLSQADVRAFCKVDEIEVIQGNGANNVLHIQVPIDMVAAVANLPYVAYLDQIPEPGEPEDTRGRGIHRSNAIDTQFSTGRKYTGEGVSVQTRDDGEVGPHIDFQGRLTNVVSTPQGGTHGDGVSGIFAGAGNLDPYMRGMAAGADLYVTQYQASFLDTTLSLHLNQEVLVTNSSYSNGCNAGYTTITQTVDQQMYENPTYLHVFSAGNSGTSNCSYGAGSNWGNITGGHKQGKNVMATANLEQDYSLRTFSSRGPAHDGRIKPDIAANGHAQQSTNPFNVYISFSGTSAAAPGIAGVTAQLHQAYRDLNGGETAEAALLKAIMLNTANDMGNPGPDFQYGWGHINALRAAKAIEEERYFSGIVDQADNNIHSIIIPTGTRLAKIMVYWHDFPAEAEANLALVNDLDAVVNNVIGTSYLPYVLDPTADPDLLNLPAIQGEDHLNNMEQIVLMDPVAGIYYLDVSGFNVPMGPVKYWVVTEFLTDEVEMIYPYGGEGLAPGSIARIHWDAYPNGSPYSLEYSLNNGQDWNTINASVSPTARFWDWEVPNNLTGEALVRVSRNSESDESDAVFSIIGTPPNLEITQACPEYIRMEWNEVDGATHYDVFQLGDRYMDSVGTTTDLFYDFETTDLDPSLDYWFSVRAAVPDQGIVGERAIAIPHNGGLLSCVQDIDVAILDINDPASSNYLHCSFNDFSISISEGNQGLTSQNSVEVGYTFNGESFTEPLGTILDPGDNFTHTFSQLPTIDADGVFELTTWVHAEDDSAVFNDTTSMIIDLTYYPDSGAPLDVQEDFEIPGLQDYWNNINEDNGIGWEPIDGIVGITGANTRTYWMDNYSYPAAGQEDRIVTVPIDLTDPSLVSPTLFFDVSYAPYAGDGYVDTFKVEVYTNCQATVSDIPYKKWGLELATDAADFGEYQPNDASDWRTEIVDLSPYIGEVVTLHFVNVTGYGNSLFLDNINITQTAPPTAFFEFPITTICTQSTWTFEDASTGDDLSYEWDFGNGASPQTATGPGPHDVLFEEPGQTTVSLTVSNTGGEDTYSFDLNVIPFTLATAAYSSNSDDLTVTFINESVDANFYEWDFGDGFGTSNEENPIYTYADPGIYQITLIASNECTSTESTGTINLMTSQSSEILGLGQLSIAPNPNNGQFTLSLNYDGSNDLEVYVLDLLGRKHYSKTLIQAELFVTSGMNYTLPIDLRDLSSGVYFIRVSDGTGDTVRKLIIE